jgi:hypothetical protein
MAARLASMRRLSPGPPGWAGGLLGPRADVPIVTARRHARFCCGWRAFGFARDATAAGFLPWRPGAARIMLGHAVQGLVDLTDSFPGDSEFLGVREGLADTAARVGDLTASVLDVGQNVGLACLQLGKAVF